MVLHKCDVRCCVNPAHLFIGTAQDNMSDCKRKGRRNHKGIRNGRARISEDDVRFIRSYQGSNADLSKRFGISVGHVGSIRRNSSWKHLT